MLGRVIVAASPFPSAVEDAGNGREIVREMTQLACKNDEEVSARLDPEKKLQCFCPRTYVAILQTILCIFRDEREPSTRPVVWDFLGMIQVSGNLILRISNGPF